MILPRKNSAAGAKKNVTMSLTGHYIKVLHQADQLDLKQIIPAKVSVDEKHVNNNSLL